MSASQSLPAAGAGAGVDPARDFINALAKRIALRSLAPQAEAASGQTQKTPSSKKVIEKSLLKITDAELKDSLESNIDYFENFKMFLKEKEKDEKFFFWVGGLEPHRAYEYKIGVNKGNKDTNSITDVPDFWPDSENVRNDMLDYAYEIEYFDHHLVKIISELEKNGL